MWNGKLDGVAWFKGRARFGRLIVVLAAVSLLATPAATAWADEPLTIVQSEGEPVILAEVGYEYWSKLSSSHVASVRLKDGSLGMVWMFHGNAGQCVQITMASSDFDPYVVLRFGSRFGDQIAADDDSGLGNSARLHGTLPSTGNYYLTATSSGAGEDDGVYTLNFDGC